VNRGSRDIAVVGGIALWAAVVMFALSQLLDFEASTRSYAMLAALALVGAGGVAYGLTRR
jgi:Zn-dependent membrane protease YugP